MNTKPISLELKGTLAGVSAALAVLGASFGLAALAQPDTPPVDSPPSGSPDGSRVVSTQIVQGHAFYTQSCAVCHGVGGRGGDGPRLIGLGLSDPQIAETIRDGVKGDMPAFRQKYQTPQVQAITAYVRSLKK